MIFFISLKRKGFFSMFTLMVLFYVIINFGAIVIDYFDFYSYICPRINFSFDATFFYCIGISATMLPFYFFHDEKIKRIEVLNRFRITDCIVYFYFFSFFVLGVFLFKDIINNQSMLALDETMKARLRFGDEVIMSSKGALTGFINTIRLFSAGSMNLIFLFFYYSCIAKRGWKICFITLVGSMCIFWDSLLLLDRSKFVYWGMTFIACFVFYRKFVEVKLKRFLEKILILFLGCIGIYLVFMNVLRFSSETGNGIAKFFSYLGQSFINFCNFYEKIDLHNYSIHGILPIVNKFFHTSDYNTWYYLTESSFGVFSMCFSTFLGEMLSEIGPLYSVLWILIFCSICFLFFKRKNLKYITLSQLFLFFLLYNVIYLGIFLYYYHIIHLNFISILLWIAIFLDSKMQRKIYLWK
jgi:hypothetical protein